MVISTQVAPVSGVPGDAPLESAARAHPVAAGGGVASAAKVAPHSAVVANSARVMAAMAARIRSRAAGRISDIEALLLNEGGRALDRHESVENWMRGCIRLLAGGGRRLGRE